jgi:hypothetical protein
MSLEQIATLASDLPSEDKLRLISILTQQMLERPEQRGPGRNRLFGALASLGAAPSAEEIDEARTEAWSSFPREDI